MNVERVHAISLAIKDEIENLKVTQLLAELTSALQNQINQPQQALYQEQVSNSKAQLSEKLSKAPSNDFSPAWNQAITELGINDKVGSTLLKRINTIFYDNQITPHVALKEIQELSTDVTAMHTNINDLIHGFEYLRIGHEELNQGEAELGILIPRTHFDNQFDKLAKELKEFNGILNTLSEVSTGNIEHFEMKSLSTSDPFIVLGGSLLALSTIAVVIKPIISTYKEILEVRLLHAQLAEKNISQDRLKGIEEHAEEIMNKKIEEIKEELISNYPVDDIGRRNELSIALGIDLKKLANRIDRGFNIEVRVQPIKLDENENNDLSEDDENHIATIQSAMKEMEFLNVEGKPILNLTETTE